MERGLFDQRADAVARVALPVPIDELFDYAIPAGLDAGARPGCRVQVRFRERTLVGVIVERSERAAFDGRLRPLERVVDTEPALSAAMIAMLRDAATEVLCPIGIAIATALPAGSAPRTAAGFAITPRGLAALETGAAQGASREVLEALRGRPRTNAQLRKAGGSDELLERLLGDGCVARSGIDVSAAARVARVRMARVPQGTGPRRGAAP